MLLAVVTAGLRFTRCRREQAAGFAQVQAKHCNLPDETKKEHFSETERKVINFKRECTLREEKTRPEEACVCCVRMDSTGHWVGGEGQPSEVQTAWMQWPHLLHVPQVECPPVSEQALKLFFLVPSDWFEAKVNENRMFMCSVNNTFEHQCCFLTSFHFGS